MREALFIKKNKDRWEKIREQQTDSVDELSTNFTQAIEDLSYSRTFYPRSATTKYLNHLAATFYLSIYRNRKEDTSRIARFFKTDLPLAMYRCRFTMAFSFVTFSLFCAIGFYSAHTDKSFITDVLGYGYVSMTEENIAKGQPFGVYAEGNELLMWLGIFFNNIKVSFIYFAGSLFLGIPFFVDMIFNTGFLGGLALYGPFNLMQEGLRLGAFEYMFYHHGLGAEAVLAVMIHGTLELAAIVIAGGAGLAMGIAFLFPGTYTRLQSFRHAARDGVKIVFALIPVFCVAGFFEGFVTRYYNMPLILNIVILLISAAYIFFYFGVYPFIVHRQQTNANTTPE